MTFFKPGFENTLTNEQKILFLSNMVKNKNNKDLSLLQTLNISFAKSLEVPENLMSLYDWSIDRMLIEEGGVEKLCFFDTETSHLNGYAVSIAFILTDLEGNVLDKEYIEMNPLVEMDSEAIEIHKLTQEYLSDKQTFVEASPRILEILNKADLLIAHNAFYDISVLIREFQRMGCKYPSIINNFLDTMVHLKNQINFINMKRKAPKLSEAAVMFNITLEGVTLHNALYDTELLKEVFFAAIKKEEFVDLTNEIVEGLKNESK